MIAVLWVLGTNYQNNLILALAFFMVSIFVVSIHLTFLNLRGLQIRYVKHGEAYAHEECDIVLKFTNVKRHWSEAISMTWRNNETQTQSLSLSPKQEKSESLLFFAGQRGRQILTPLCVESVFPLGLIRCWTWLRWDADIVVYPEPVAASMSAIGEGEDAEIGGTVRQGGEDITGLRRYQESDSPGVIYWKAYARGQGLLSKEFTQTLSHALWLDFHALAGHSFEKKLSILCHWVVHYSQQEAVFGLVLPSQTIAPSSGAQHRDTCLMALAEC